MNWELVGQFILENIGFLYQNFSLYFVVLTVLVMAVIVGLCALLKKPIKALTKNIKNEKLRKLANKSIIALAYGLSIGLYYFLSWVLPQFITINWVQITLSASLAIVAYSVGDGIITKDKAKSAITDIQNIFKDGKIDGQDKGAIQEFYDKVK